MLHQEGHPTVLVADDHRAVREGVAQLLKDNGFHVSAQADTREEVLALVQDTKPDAAIVDLSIDGDTGLALVFDLYRLDIPVVVCSSHEAPSLVRRALDAGARAYVAKRDVPRLLVRTLEDVLDGWVLVTPRAADGLHGST